MMINPVELEIGAGAMVGLQNLRTQVLVNCRRAKTAFVLATIEQLIPVLSAGSLQDWVLPICLPILEDDEHREAYESAHSVLLAIFSSRAQDLLATPHDIDPYPSANTHDMSERQTHKLATNIDTTIAVRLLPLYTSYLIESSRQGKLNVHQLRLAFSTVVRFASASVKATTSEEPTSTAEKYGLTWYCIEALLNAIRDLSDERTRSQSLGAYDDHRHRLHLMLISTIPSLPLDLLPRALDEIRAIIIQGRKRHIDLGSTPARLADREARCKELNQALLSEILEGVGDLEKDFVMRWWYDNRHILEDDIRPGADHQRLGSARKKEVKNPDGALSQFLVTKLDGINCTPHIWSHLYKQVTGPAKQEITDSAKPVLPRLAAGNSAQDQFHHEGAPGCTHPGLASSFFNFIKQGDERCV
ncbi:hypothetical protein AB1N83_010456 [Pleurotus pulmonarius]